MYIINSYSPTLVGKFSMFAINNTNITAYDFCTSQNLFVMLTYSNTLQVYNLSVYSLYPPQQPQQTYNLILQTLMLNYSQYGTNLSLACQQNYLSLMNNVGQVFIFQYIPSPTTSNTWWPIVVGCVGGVIVIVAIVLFIMYRKKKLKQ
jgi:hypothetical protein